MEKQEIVNSLRSEILNVIQTEKYAYEQIDDLVDRCFDNLIKVYEMYNVSIKAINSYSDENKEIVKQDLKKLCDGRKEIEYAHVNAIINKIQRRVEEQEENIHNEEDVERISDMELNDTGNANSVLDEIIYSLGNVRNQAARELQYNGYKDSRIEKIITTANKYISELKPKISDKIEESFIEDKKQTVSKIIEEYESATKVLEGQKVDEAKEFREELSVEGLDLEKQKENTEKFLETAKENEQKQEKEEREDSVGVLSDVII